MDFWTAPADVQVEKDIGNHLIARHLSIGKAVGYEFNETFAEFLVYLKQGVYSTVQLESWGQTHGISSHDIHQTLSVLMQDNIVLRGTHELKLPQEDRFWSYLSAQTNDLNNLEEALGQWNNSDICVIGIGGVGSRVAWELAALSVGKLTLIDDDVVKSHNLSHQPFFTKDDIGKPKTYALQREIARRFDTTVRVVNSRVASQLTQELQQVLFSSSLVIVCADEPSVDAIADYLSPILLEHQIPHIVGGGYQGHVSNTGMTIIPGQTSCWTCADSIRFPSRLEKTEAIYARGIHGTYPPTVNLVSSLLVADAVAVLTRLQPPLLANRMGDFNWENGTVEWRYVQRNQDCRVCSMK